MIREGDELICWEHRSFIPPPRMLLETEGIQEIIDLISELIEVARLKEVPVWDIYAFLDLSISTVLNIKAIIQRSKVDLDLIIHTLKQDEEALWGWLGKCHGLTLRDGPTAMIHVHHNSLFCILGEEGRIHQIKKIQWSLLEQTDLHFGKNPNRLNFSQIRSLERDIADRLNTFQWSIRPHNLVLSGTAVEAFSFLFRTTTSENQIHNASFSRADIRQWIDTLSQSSRNSRTRLMGANSDWQDGIISVCMLLMELCNRSYKDSFIISEGMVGMGILICVE